MEQEFRIVRPGSRLLMFIILWLMSAIAFTGLSLLIGMLFYDNEIIASGISPPISQDQLSWLRTLQFMNQLGVLILPVVLFAFLVSGRQGMGQQLWPGFRLQWQHIIISFLILLCFLPLVNLLVEWNAGIRLPQSLKGLEAWMQDREEAASQLSEAFLQGADYKSLILNLIIVALLPAIGEEMLFRGTLLPLLRDWTQSKHAGVWLSALLFSVVHMQFFGFVPRMFLGLILGYAFIRSGSLWLPVLIHLFNNGAIVLLTWFSERGMIQLDEDQLSAFHPTWAIVVGALLGLGIFLLYSPRQQKDLVKDVDA